MITGQQIRETREAKGLSRREVAAMAGISEMGVRSVEADKYSGKSKVAILKAIGLTEAPGQNGDVQKVKKKSKGDYVKRMAAIEEEEKKAKQQDEVHRITVKVSHPPASVTIPGALLAVAREEKLTVDQVVTLSLIGDFIHAACNLSGPFNADDWRQLLKGVKGWL